MKTILSFIALMSNIYFVWSYSTGAPNSKSVCKTRLPHHGVNPQEGTSPYFITVNTTSPGYGQLIEVTIGVKDKTTTLKGFIVQAMSKVDNLVTKGPASIGAFTGNERNLISCFADFDSVTHSENGEKSSVKLVFKVTSTASFHFRATIVQNFMTFWTEVASEIISPIDSGSSPSDDWTRTVIDAASSVSKGKQSWDKNLQERLKHGFSGMVDSVGQLKTKTIFSNLPFQSKYSNNNDTDSNSLYKSDKNLDTLPTETLTKELLQGDLNSAVFLVKKLTISKQFKSTKQF